MTTHCPNSGIALEVVKASGMTKSATRFADHLRRLWQGGDMRLHSDVPAIRDAPLPQVALEPGETRELMQYRPKAVADLAPPFAWGLILGLPTGAIVGIAGAPQKWALGVGGIVFVGSFLAASWPVVFGTGGPNLLALIEKMTRKDINGDGVIGEQPEQPPIRVDFSQRQGTGRQTKRLEIPCPQVGEEMLARWFWRVCREDGSRFSIRAALGYSLTRTEAEGVQEYFVTNRLAEHKGNIITPTPEGIAVMWGVVERHYPYARLSPSDESNV